MKYLLILLIGFAAAAAQAKESILISLVNQQLYLYQGNKIIFSTPVSTGRKSMATQPGRYVIDLKKLSIPDPKYHMTLPYFMAWGLILRSEFTTRIIPATRLATDAFASAL